MKVLTRPDDKIKLLCPHGHPMFETGILVKTLHKGHGIRIRTDQLVREGYDWSKMEAAMLKMGVSQADLDSRKGRSKDVALCPVYQLDEDQCKQMTRVKCSTCYPRETKGE